MSLESTASKNRQRRALLSSQLSLRLAHQGWRRLTYVPLAVWDGRESLVPFSWRFQECCFWQLDDREGRKELQLSLFDVLTLQDPGEGKLGCWGCWAVGGPAVLSYIHVPHIASKLMIRQKRDRIAEEEI